MNSNSSILENPAFNKKEKTSMIHEEIVEDIEENTQKTKSKKENSTIDKTYQISEKLKIEKEKYKNIATYENNSINKEKDDKTLIVDKFKLNIPLSINNNHSPNYTNKNEEKNINHNSKASIFINECESIDEDEDDLDDIEFNNPMQPIYMTKSLCLNGEKTSSSPTVGPISLSQTLPINFSKDSKKELLQQSLMNSGSLFRMRSNSLSSSNVLNLEPIGFSTSYSNMQQDKKIDNPIKAASVEGKRNININLQEENSNINEKNVIKADQVKDNNPNKKVIPREQSNNGDYNNIIKQENQYPKKMQTNLNLSLNLSNLPKSNENRKTNKEDKKIEMKINCNADDDEFISERGEKYYKELKEQKYTNVMSEIFPFLYLSGSAPAHDAEKLKKYNIQCIINCAAEIVPDMTDEEAKLGGIDYKIKYLPLCIRDSQTASAELECSLMPCIELIEKARRLGQNILVHCEKGVSRSASIVIAYIMWRYDVNYQRAFCHVRAKRPIASPNVGFFFLLSHDWWTRRHADVERAMAAASLRMTVPDGSLPKLLTFEEALSLSDNDETLKQTFETAFNICRKPSKYRGYSSLFKVAGAKIAYAINNLNSSSSSLSEGKNSNTKIIEDNNKLIQKKSLIKRQRCWKIGARVMHVSERPIPVEVLSLWKENVSKNNSPKLINTFEHHEKRESNSGPEMDSPNDHSSSLISTDSISITNLKHQTYQRYIISPKSVYITPTFFGIVIIRDTVSQIYSIMTALSIKIPNIEKLEEIASIQKYSPETGKENNIKNIVETSISESEVVLQKMVKTLLKLTSENNIEKQTNTSSSIDEDFFYGLNSSTNSYNNTFTEDETNFDDKLSQNLQSMEMSKHILALKTKINHMEQRLKILKTFINNVNLLSDSSLSKPEIKKRRIEINEPDNVWVYMHVLFILTLYIIRYQDVIIKREIRRMQRFDGGSCHVFTIDRTELEKHCNIIEGARYMKNRNKILTNSQLKLTPQLIKNYSLDFSLPLQTNKKDSPHKQSGNSFSHLFLKHSETISPRKSHSDNTNNQNLTVQIPPDNLQVNNSMPNSGRKKLTLTDKNLVNVQFIQNQDLNYTNYHNVIYSNRSSPTWKNTNQISVFKIFDNEKVKSRYSISCSAESKSRTNINNDQDTIKITNKENTTDMYIISQNDYNEICCKNSEELNNIICKPDTDIVSVPSPLCLSSNIYANRSNLSPNFQGQTQNQNMGDTFIKKQKLRNITTRYSSRNQNISKKSGNYENILTFCNIPLDESPLAALNFITKLYSNNKTEVKGSDNKTKIKEDIYNNNNQILLTQDRQKTEKLTSKPLVVIPADDGEYNKEVAKKAVSLNYLNKYWKMFLNFSFTKTYDFSNCDRFNDNSDNESCFGIVTKKMFKQIRSECGFSSYNYYVNSSSQQYTDIQKSLDSVAIAITTLASLGFLSFLQNSGSTTQNLATETKINGSLNKLELNKRSDLSNIQICFDENMSIPHVRNILCAVKTLGSVGIWSDENDATASNDLECLIKGFLDY